MVFNPAVSWPFSDPRETPVFVLDRILEGWEPITCVTHDADDGAWQFLAGDKELNEEDMRVVKFEEVLALDPSVALLADLPLGWRAWREAAHMPWQRLEEREEN